MDGRVLLAETVQSKQIHKGQKDSFAPMRIMSDAERKAEQRERMKMTYAGELPGATH